MLLGEFHYVTEM